MAASVADQLRAFGVQGILITAAEQGKITEFKCAIPGCLCPRGEQYFENVNSDREDWIPTLDHYPKLKHEHGHKTVDNVRLAHRLCNRVDFARAEKRTYDNDPKRVEAERVLMETERAGGDKQEQLRPYDERGLLSFFGYGRAAHERSGGICQLCGAGAGPDIHFDLWRHFTIEHLIGDSQGGYPPRIRVAVDARFIDLSTEERADLAKRIHEANIVTACQFCNSTTSHDRAPFTMEEAVAELPDDPEEALVALAGKLQSVLDAKRAVVK